MSNPALNLQPEGDSASLEVCQSHQTVCAPSAENDMFRPWIGNKWGQSDNTLGGTRLLIVGESHYCSPEQPELVGQCLPETTAEVVEDLAIRGSHRFFTGLTQIICGRPKWSMDRGEVDALWHALTFYNYVPAFVATGPRVRPTGAMFESGRAPFANVLIELRPQTIIVCGRDLWWWMRRGLLAGTTAPPPAEECRIGPALAVRIMHPSATGFSSTGTRPIVERLLAQVRQE